MVDLPWNDCTTDNLSLKHAKKVLDKDHYGMEKVKERILEYLAVRALRDDLKSPILCLFGLRELVKPVSAKALHKRWAVNT